MGPLSALRHVIWDLGGTLIDTYPVTVEVFLDTLRDLGVEADSRQVRALYRTSTDHAIRVTAERYGVDPVRLRERQRAAAARVPPAEFPAFPGARAVLARVRERGGKNLLVTHRGRAGALGLLAAHGLDRLIDDLVTGDDPWPRKPDPASMLAVIARNSLDRAACLAVGDRALDVEAGRRAGVRTCLVGYSSPEVEADLHLGRLDELFDHLTRSGSA